MTMNERIRQKLTQALDPESLEITDESHLHAGHAGARPGGETHFRVHIVAGAFQGLNRVKRHRLVNEVLKDELATSVHALALKTLSPDEVGSRR